MPSFPWWGGWLCLLQRSSLFKGWERYLKVTPLWYGLKSFNKHFFNCIVFVGTWKETDPLVGVHVGVRNLESVCLPIRSRFKWHDFPLQHHNVLVMDYLHLPKLWGVGCRLLPLFGTLWSYQIGGFGTSQSELNINKIFVMTWHEITIY